MTCIDYTIDVTEEVLSVDSTEETLTVDVTQAADNSVDVTEESLNVGVTDPSYTIELTTPGVSEFTKLTDTPFTYLDQAGKILTVNSDETAVEFSTLISKDNKIYQSGYPNTYIKFNNGVLEIWAGGILQDSWN